MAKESKLDKFLDNIKLSRSSFLKVSTSITPPDLVSQTFLAILMILLFEASIGVSYIVYKKRIKKSK